MSQPLSDPTEPSRAARAPGTILEGRYRIDTVLGEGGVGAVYRARHLRLDTDVAVKLLHPEHLDALDIRTRFEREARVLAGLSHPHIVGLSDYGISGDTPYLVMELLEGRTLREALEDDGAFPPKRAQTIIEQVLRALGYAHGRGLVHRDLKPDNLFLQALPDSPDHVRVLDFGLAKFVASDVDETGVSVTRTGQIFGTPGYMAPEQASGGPMDARTDVYAVGVLLFELLAGRRPFIGQSAEVLRAHLAEERPLIDNVRSGRKESAALREVLDRSMAKDPQDRFDHAEDMLNALRAIDGPWIALDPKHRSIYDRETTPPAPRTHLEVSAAYEATMPDVATSQEVTKPGPVSTKPAAAARGIASRKKRSGSRLAALFVGTVALLGIAIAFLSRPPSAEAPALLIQTSPAERWGELSPGLLRLRDRLANQEPISNQGQGQLRRMAQRDDETGGAAAALLGRLRLREDLPGPALHHYQTALSRAPWLAFDPAVRADLAALARDPETERETTAWLRDVPDAEGIVPQLAAPRAP